MHITSVGILNVCNFSILLRKIVIQYILSAGNFIFIDSFVITVEEVMSTWKSVNSHFDITSVNYDVTSVSYDVTSVVNFDVTFVKFDIISVNFNITSGYLDGTSGNFDITSVNFNSCRDILQVHKAPLLLSHFIENGYTSEGKVSELFTILEIFHLARRTLASNVTSLFCQFVFF